jgi:integrase
MSRVYERNKGEWWIDFRDAAGLRHRRKIGPSKRIAREVLDGLLGNVARRQHLGIIDDSAISFVDFAKVWWERVAHGLRPSTQVRWKGICEKHLKPAFPGSLRGITAASAESYIAKRLEAGATPSTVNREVMVLKHMLKRAVLWEYLTLTPLANLKAQREPDGRSRYLAIDEVENLLACCPPKGTRSALLDVYLRPFVLVALNTGMRRGEILSLTRRSVDWQNHAVKLEQTKNGESRYVFLNDEAYQALRALPTRIDTELLFPIYKEQLSKAFRKSCAEAKIEDFRLHDLRHTFASYQAMAGVQGRTLQALLGHKDMRMTVRYSHLSDAHLRAAVNAIGFGTAKRQAS